LSGSPGRETAVHTCSSARHRLLVTIDRLFSCRPEQRVLRRVFEFDYFHNPYSRERDQQGFTARLQQLDPTVAGIHQTATILKARLHKIVNLDLAMMESFQPHR